MFDIIQCNADPKKYRFEKFYSMEAAKSRVMKFPEVTEAVNAKNKKNLIVLDDWKFDDGAIKVIGEKKSACFLVDLSRILKSRGIRRAVEISKIRNFLRLCNKHGTFYTFASFSEKEEEIRSADELLHIAMLFDINRGQAKFAMKMLGEYL